MSTLVLIVAVGAVIIGAALWGGQWLEGDDSVTVSASEAMPLDGDAWPLPTTAEPDMPRHVGGTTSTTPPPPPTTTTTHAPKVIRPSTTTTTRPKPAAGDVARGLAPNAFLACVAKWESGSRYDSVGGGMYGIIDSTWQNRTLGYSARYGTAHSWHASPAAQDEAALDLFRRYGTKPWTTRGKCGG